MNGVLVIDKPRGPTSFDLVARVRRAAAERRVGHAGTLDPMASGVLLICLGEATKLVPYLMDADKEYRATVRLGVSTDTDDADVGARVIAEAAPEALAALREEQVRAALAEQVGPRRQVPPRYCALKVEGERLYDLARLARTGAADIEAQIAAKAREVQIYELRLEAVALPEVTFFIRCGKGTYVRSVARDLGERLGVGGHLIALRRLRVGRFTVDQATPLIHEEGQGGKRGSDRFAGPPRLFTPAEALAHLPAVQVPRETAERVRNGQLAAVAEAAAGLPAELGGEQDRGEAHAAVLDEAGGLAAVLVRRRGDDGWRVGRGFARVLLVLLCLASLAGGAAPSLAAGPGGPEPGALWQEAGAAVRPDPPPPELVRDTHYIISNENNHERFRAAVTDLGGVYIGVGSEQNYLIAGWARSEALVLMDFDQMVVDLHRVYRVLFLSAKDPAAFRRLWDRSREAEVLALLREAYPGAEGKGAVRAYRRSRYAIPERLDKLIARYGAAGIPTFLDDAAQYEHLAGLFRAGRVLAVRGDLTVGGALRDVAALARRAGLPVRVVYLSNAERYFPYNDDFKRSLRELPMDERSLLLRTMARKNGAYDYFIQSGTAFQAWLGRRGAQRVQQLVYGGGRGSPLRRHRPDGAVDLGVPMGAGPGMR